MRRRTPSPAPDDPAAGAIPRLPFLAPEARRRGGGLVVGAAIGIGMTAQAAERGGADFLLALNAGRLRVMGAASVVAMLPLCAANAFTDDFARREILGRVGIPVLFGACAQDPRLNMARDLPALRAAGYAGIANFPTVIHYDGRFRQALEEAGLGFAREVALLRAARRAGLATLGYGKTRAEAEALVEAGVDMLCLNFGWNAGGSRGAQASLRLEEAADRARRIFQQVRAAAPGLLCLVEGGPIVSPDQLHRVRAESRADGYLGGSTLDRLPLELSVAQSTSAFKTVALLADAAEAEARGAARRARLAGLVFQSEAMADIADRIARLAATDLPLLLTGEPGAGKTAAARALHAASGRRGLTLVDAALGTGDAAATLFGQGGARAGALAEPGTTVLLENLEALPLPAQLDLAGWLEAGAMGRGRQAPPPRARLIATSARDLAGLMAAGRFREDLWALLFAGRIPVPPLRERPEDCVALARHVLRRLPGTPDLAPDALRALVVHPWPGNVRELRSVLERAATACRAGRIEAADLAPLLAPSVAAPAEAGRDERAWIQDALRRHRFRRGETAAFLGISRKTLYNRMRRLGLLA
ncbi:phosphoenolpyruvate hydrolase family protein [Paracraurococcus ruber]|uniref:Sigma-54 factor interaction domain-containing protein n=1 Tax=Paracraurococcus ruber TaxID=77675 RepID=A0ABS1CS28_9PROT|nr:phosphoenolpyruvate hydrolase family protein [Paracraurococcus ruber]MBK1657270.1 hypothetical protein [Paracraurococcus ruber]TDG33158.1 sigma-54-dependent Fis family transcriptional regulator [Paracraurococcus ruber]